MAVLLLRALRRTAACGIGFPAKGGWRLAVGEHALGRNSGRVSRAVTLFVKRWWWALLVLAVGLGVCRLRFDVDVLNLLPPDEPTVQGLKLYEKPLTNPRQLLSFFRPPAPTT